MNNLDDMFTLMERKMHKIFEVIEATQKVLDNNKKALDDTMDTINSATSEVDAILQENTEIISKFEEIRDRYAKDNNSLSEEDKNYVSSHNKYALEYIQKSEHFIAMLNMTIEVRGQGLKAIARIGSSLKKQKPDNSTTSISHTTDTSPYPSSRSMG